MWKDPGFRRKVQFWAMEMKLVTWLDRDPSATAAGYVAQFSIVGL